MSVFVLFLGQEREMSLGRWDLLGTWIMKSESLIGSVFAFHSLSAFVHRARIEGP